MNASEWTNVANERAMGFQSILNSSILRLSWKFRILASYMLLKAKLFLLRLLLLYMIKLFQILQVRACLYYSFYFLGFAIVVSSLFIVHHLLFFFFFFVWIHLTLCENISYVWPCQCLYKVSNWIVQQMPQVYVVWTLWNFTDELNDSMAIIRVR